MRLIIGMGKGNTNDEIMDYFDLDPDLIPTQSAFHQRRNQISLSAFEYLFSEFSAAFPTTTNKFKDHCILACDGCHVVYTTNSEIIEDYNKPRLIDYKGYNHMHVNAFVDVLKQEIYANLILYNFGIFLANEATEENQKKKRKKDNKYNYKIDFSSALKTARKFFLREDSHKPVNIIKLMMKYVHAVKTEFRQFAHPLRGIGAIHFGYR